LSSESPHCPGLSFLWMGALCVLIMLWLQTYVTVNQYPTYRSLNNFEYPSEFMPERFLPSASSEGFTRDNKAAFQPLGLGRHACICQSLACAEMRLILARLFLPWTLNLRMPRIYGIGVAKRRSYFGRKSRLTCVWEWLAISNSNGMAYIALRPTGFGFNI
jgi:hypothetical protein